MIKKVLVVRFSSIGDIVLTSPVIRAIKLQIPGVRVDFLTKQSMLSIMEANPYIDRLIGIKDEVDEVIEILKLENYDVIVDLHRNLRTFRLKKKLGRPAYAFDKLNIRKWLLVNLKLNLMPDKHIVDRYFDAVRELKVSNDGQGLDYFIPEHVKLSDRDIPLSHSAGYVAFVIGGSYATKQLPAAQWVKLASLQPFPVILLGGPEDAAMGDEIASADPVKIYNACGKFSLHESALLVQYSRLVVSNDTGLMHIAAALRKPVASLWGNTVPSFGMSAYYGAQTAQYFASGLSVNLEHGISCRPCSKLGYRKCPRKHFNCMNQLDMQFLANWIRSNWTQKI